MTRFVGPEEFGLIVPWAINQGEVILILVLWH